PASLNFGNVTVGKSVSQKVSIKNSGTATVNITSATLSSTQFTMSGITMPFALTAGATANISISFNGTTKGTANGVVTLHTDTGSVAAPFSITANATSAQAQLGANPASVNFGSVTSGTKDTSTVTLSNDGGSDLNISMISINGAEFGVSGITTPKTIPA